MCIDRQTVHNCTGVNILGSTQKKVQLYNTLYKLFAVIQAIFDSVDEIASEPLFDMKYSKKNVLMYSLWLYCNFFRVYFF